MKLDAEVASLYFEAVKDAEMDAERRKIQKVQRVWLGARDACSDRDCLERRYETGKGILVDIRAWQRVNRADPYPCAPPALQLSFVEER